MNNNWYSLHVMAGKEAKTRDNLLARAIACKAWQESIFDFLIPTEKEYVTKRGKRQIVDKKVFPGYIFVRMYLDKDTEQIVQGAEGVIGFVKNGSRPSPMPDHEIKAILKKLENDNETPKSTYRANDIVTIVSGPFADFSAKVETVDDVKGKIKGYVNIFGRDTLVELQMKDIQRLA